MTEQLPVLASDLTAEWLRSKLSLQIKSIKNTRSIWGTGSKLFYTITYTDDGGEESNEIRPRYICIKGVFNAEIITSYPSTVGMARREAEFYAKVAPSLQCKTYPKIWWSAASDNQGIIVMSDLTVEGCTFPRETDSYTVETVMDGAEQLAGLHA